MVRRTPDWRLQPEQIKMKQRRRTGSVTKSAMPNSRRAAQWPTLSIFDELSPGSMKHGTRRSPQVSAFCHWSPVPPSRRPFVPVFILPPSSPSRAARPVHPFARQPLSAGDVLYMVVTRHRAGTDGLRADMEALPSGKKRRHLAVAARRGGSSVTVTREAAGHYA